ncbi:MAG TPA: 1-(5-phosphoribosyl)-5-[(5-phosphoribosylamino)methylideneamino]imidazole-4-carboxamide isomerase [Dongiaceae bacterium]|jgi:phosphoribosylformimino-5-aminoimidazole carboxamide ribotide isomerase|nr:1-(5-phosphoribosyl)-5-[(5-phosphoribosylamino)methylideneamino]imidazole-4-carboxamide isomerase [Dongiaceae bacterium]
MILYPAIDLKDGVCVRLLRGDMARATVFSQDPPAQALAFQEAGARYLHLVDLNGAVAGRSVNGAAIEAILSRLSIPVQLGGGIRTHADIDYWLDRGVARVIVGSAALRTPHLVSEAARRHPGRIAVALDARQGFLAAEGWVETTAMTVEDVAALFADEPLGAFIHTDIERDGAGAGFNLEASVDLARRTAIPVIVSGGCHSLEDITALKKSGLAGAVVGRALYDGSLDLGAALRLLDGQG